MELITPRLVLGPPRSKDTEPLYAALVGGNVTETIVWDGPADVEEYRRCLRRYARQHRYRPEHFVIRQRETGQPVGMVSLRLTDWVGRSSLGYWLSEDWQGQGLMTEAVAELVRWGFDQLRLDLIEANVFVGNDASRKVLIKCGLKQCDFLPLSLLKRGRWIDKWAFRLSREEWYAQTASPASCELAAPQSV